MNQLKRVAVLGSNSFSGVDFIDYLLETGHYEVIGISRSEKKSRIFIPDSCFGSKNFTFYQLDFNKDIHRLIFLLDDFKPQYIINFAAQSEVAPSWESPVDWYQTNVLALTALAFQLKDRDYLERFVQISSPEVYGSCTGVIKENAPANPSTPYAASKVSGDFSLMTFYKNYQFPVVIVRSTNVYGPGQQLFKIIPRSVINIKSANLIDLHGGGHAVKSYIHIRDISRGELAIMEGGALGEIYHLSPKKGYSVRSIVEKISALMGVPFESCTRDVAERLGQDAVYEIDSTKVTEQFAWKPEISIDEGLKNVVHWISECWDNIVEEEKFYIHKK